MATLFTHLRTMATGIKMLCLIVCLSLFAPAAFSQTTKGYEFFVAEQPNDPATSSNFVIAVANSSATAATVKIYRPDSTGGFNLLETRVVGVGMLEQFSYASANPFISRVRGAGNIQTASTAFYVSNVYRIVSDVKVVAYSFTPLANVRSNDANLLLPTHALGKKHYLGSYVSFNVNGTYASQVGIVATKPGNTNVKIYNRLGALVDNINLFQGQYFQRLNGNVAATDDMTGWYVESDQAVAVFTGNQITAVGTTIGASDHLCEQVLPYETLAKAYVAAPSNSRPVGCTGNNCGPDIFRYVGTKNGTVVNTSVVLAGRVVNASNVSTNVTVGPSNPVTINKGEYLEITTNLAHIASASEPFYGYQYLVSQNQTTSVAANRTGDPSLLVLPVVDQFLYDYTFLFPPAFLYNFLHVVAPVNTTFTIDGIVQNPTWRAAGSYNGTSYQVAVLQLPAGAHKIVGDKKMGIQVVAFETFASYAYLGGSGLEPINAGCITGGPYLKLDCFNRQEQIQLHGFPSCEDGGTPSITWTSSDGVVFSNPNIVNPVATVPGYGTYEVTMIVQCGSNVTTCTSEIIVREPAAGCPNIPISLTPPPDKVVPTDAGQNYATNVNIGVATYVADEPAVLTSDSLSQWPLGETTVTWTVYDPYGRSASGTHKITVVPPPTIVAPPAIIVPTDAGQNYATVNNLYNTGYWSYNQSGGTYWVYNNTTEPSAAGVPSGNQFSVGDNIVTWTTAPDQWGRTASGTQIVRVIPAPSLVPPPAILVPTDAGQNYATVNSLHNANYWQYAQSGGTFWAYGNSNTPSVSGVPSGNQFVTGSTTVTWTIVDSFGRSASGTQVVKVVPPPSIVPPAIIIVPSDAGQNYATVNDLYSSGYWVYNETGGTYWVYENSSIPTASGVPANNQYSIGDNVVTWTTGADQWGRTASGTQIVRVIPGPSIVPPPMIVVPTDAGQNYATVSSLYAANYWQYAQSGGTYWAYGNTAEPTASGVPSGNQFNVGDNTVTYTVTDQFGRTASGTQIVRVIPGPSIVPPPIIVVPTDAGQNYATVSSLYAANYWQYAQSGGTYWAYGNSNIPTASGVAANNQYNVGDNVITYTVTDAFGRSVSGTQIVRVIPGPSIVPPPIIVVPTDAGQNYATVSSLYAANYWQYAQSGGTYWAYGNSNIPTASGVAANNQYNVGDNVITYTVTDAYGRSVSGTQIVRVIPGPSIVPPPIIVVPTDAGQNYATVTELYDANYWQYAQSGGTYWAYGNTNEPTASGVPSGNQFNVGDNTVTYTVTDQFGRTASGTQIVRVIPGPSIVPPPMIVVPTDAGQNYATVTDLYPANYWQYGQGSGFTYWVYNDNSLPTSTGIPAGNKFNVGDNVITWSVTDEFGRTASGTQIVRVIPGPSIVPPPIIVVPTDAGQNYATVSSLYAANYWQYAQSGGTYWAYGNSNIPSASGVAANNQYNVGDNIITYTVTDAFGRSVSGTQIVRVVPPPTIVAPPAIVTPADANQNFATVNTLYPSGYWQYGQGSGNTYWVYNNTSIPTATGVPAGNKFPVGVTTITWTTGADQWGRTASGTQTITVTQTTCPNVTASIVAVNDACGVKLTANGGTAFQWSFGGSNVSSSQTVILGQDAAAGIYTIRVSNSCGNSATATYTFAGFNPPSNTSDYTIIGYKTVRLGESNSVTGGGVGVTACNGTAAFKKNSSVSGTVRAKYITVQNPSNIPNKVYGKAVVNLPAMQYYSGNCNSFSDYTVNSNITITLNNNYRNVYIKKGANVTLGGSIFKSVTIEEGATVKFNAATINIESLYIGKGLSGIATVRFNNNTSVRVSTQVKVEERNVINPDNVNVWFYMGDSNCDDEKFTVKGDGSRINANIYMPNGTLYVQSDCGHGSGCGHSYSSYSSSTCNTTYMNGTFIAEYVESGNSVSWAGSSTTPSNCNTLNVPDNVDPVINCPGAQQFCKSSNGSYTIPAATASDNSGVYSISYTMTGATTRSGSGGNASGTFGVGTTTITFKVVDANENESTCTTVVKVSAAPDANISSTPTNVFCGEITLSVSACSAPSGATYQWLYNNNVVGSGSTLALGSGNGEGVYTLSVTAGGCTNANADTYTFSSQNLLNKYTIVGINKVSLGENNDIQTGSVGVMSSCGSASFRKNSEVTSAGSFVKAKSINTISSPVTITNKIYAPAVVNLPVMQYFSGNCNYYSSYTVAQNATVTLNNNYNCLTVRKNATATLNGNTFRKVILEENAKVTFTAATINIEELYVYNGSSTGYTRVFFANNANVRIKTGVTIEERCQINPTGKNVVFYVGSNSSSCGGSDASFVVYGSGTTVNAIVYVPEGDIKVTAGSSSSGSCYSYSTPTYETGYMNGIFIADQVLSDNSKNIMWNGYSCSSARIGNTPIAGGTTKQPEVADAFVVSAAPNPSTNLFTLQMKTKSTELVNIKIVDISGRLIETIINQEPTTVFRLGAKWTNGVYFAEVTQGGERQTLRLVKAN